MRISHDAGSAVDGMDVRSGPSDAELIAAVRGGDNDAYGELYQRHSVAAYGLARQLASSPSAADDLVAEAFAKVLEALRIGRGPDSAFRAYLLTTLRHGLYDNSRRDRRIQFSDDLTSVDPGTPFVDTPIRDLEASLVARAFAALPERWQTVLWHTEIEGQKPADVAPLLGLTANGAAALAYRAREGLRQAYLQAHLADSAEDDCRFTVERLGAWARDGLAKREKTKVEDHLATCERCRLLSGELVDVNSGLRAIVAPLVLGAPFVAGYLASLTVGAGAAGGASLTAAASSSSSSHAGAAGGTASGTGAAGSLGGGTGAVGVIGGGAGTAGGASAAGAAVAAVGVTAGITAGGALVAAIAAAAVIAVAGVAYAVTRGDDSPTNQAGISLSASPQASSSSSPSGSPSASGSSSRPSTSPSSTASPSSISTSPSLSTTPSTTPTPTPSTTTAAAPVPAPTSDEPSTSDAPALTPLSVGVSLSVDNSDMGESGTLSGGVGPNPQIRLLSAVPAGWSVTISGPCLEGGGGAVCTLPGGQGAASITVEVTRPPDSTESPSITIGLFADAGDATPVDSF